MVTLAWARRKEWIQKNPEKYRAQKRADYLRDRERISQRNKECSAERVEANRNYYKKHPEKLVARWLKSGYRMTIDEYNSMLSRQGGQCAICRIDHKETRQRKLHVDHCHTTNVIRGLLCEHCNRMLGLAKDNLKTLASAIDYLAGGRDSKH